MEYCKDVLACFQPVCRADGTKVSTPPSPFTRLHWLNCINFTIYNKRFPVFSQQDEALVVLFRSKLTRKACVHLIDGWKEANPLGNFYLTAARTQRCFWVRILLIMTRTNHNTVWCLSFTRLEISVFCCRTWGIHRLRWRFGDGQNGWNIKLFMNTPSTKSLR